MPNKPKLVATLTLISACLFSILSAQDSAPNPKFLFQSQSNLVVLDVVVNDANGVPVHNLKASDFTVYEDGHPMTIKTFDEHCTDLNPPPPPTPIKLPVNTFTNYTPTPGNGTLNVLLFDPLNTPWQSQSYVLWQMRQFAKTLPAGTPVAIFSLTARLELVQGFTTDPALIQAALAKLVPYTSVISSEHSRTALGALARYLGTLPGRKNLLWFTGGFPLATVPTPGLGASGSAPAGAPPSFGPTAGGSSLTASGTFNEDDDLQVINDRMVHAHVAVYPIDARGVQWVPEAGLSMDAHFSDTLNQQHQTMQVVADQTGGKAFYSTNDLTAATREAINDGSNFYTFTYVPADPKLNGKFRKFKVDLVGPAAQQHLHLSYRKGYYADDLDALDMYHKSKPETPEQKAMKTTMQVAMAHGGPTPTQLLFTASVSPAPTVSDLPANNTANNKIMKHPPYRSYTIRYNADVSNLTTTPATNGTRQADIEVVAVLYNDNGQAVDVANYATRLLIAPEKYPGLLKDGLHMHQTIDAPTKGNFYLRLGIHDLDNDTTGVLEIPLNQLQQQSAPTLLPVSALK